MGRCAALERSSKTRRRQRYERCATAINKLLYRVNKSTAVARRRRRKNRAEARSKFGSITFFFPLCLRERVENKSPKSLTPFLSWIAMVSSRHVNDLQERKKKKTFQGPLKIRSTVCVFYQSLNIISVYQCKCSTERSSERLSLKRP